MGKGVDYLLHYFNRLQVNNFDVNIIASGPKGTGKSSAAIYFARRYLKKFGFVCPKCENTFFKNVYSLKHKDGINVFEIPNYVKNNTAFIKCPEQYLLDRKTGEKEKQSGCGYEFHWNERIVPKWKAQDYIAYDNQDIFQKLYNAPIGSPLIFDEAVKAIAAQNHNKTDVKALKELLTVIRPKKYIIFWCIPNFQWVDSKLREEMSSFWLRLLERGDAVLFEKDKGESKDQYHTKLLEKVMGQIRFFTPMEKIKRQLKKHPCYFDAFKLPEIPEKVYKEYELVRNSILLQRQAEELELSNKDMAKMMAWNLMNHWDRIKIAVDRSREAKPTYDMMTREILVNPVSRKSLVSEPTLRNWNRGVDDFVKTKGKDALTFDGEFGKDA